MTLVSNALRKSAGHHDAQCQFNIAGVCNGLGCVLCHIRLIGEAGGGQKPDDTCAAHGCGACHDVFDGRVPGLEKNSTDWNFYALRALVRQMRWWQQWGFITVKGAK
jgi:hypothetical protein